MHDKTKFISEDADDESRSKSADSIQQMFPNETKKNSLHWPVKMFAQKSRKWKEVALILN